MGVSSGRVGDKFWIRFWCDCDKKRKAQSHCPICDQCILWVPTTPIVQTSEGELVSCPKCGVNLYATYDHTMPIEVRTNDPK